MQNTNMVAGDTDVFQLNPLLCMTNMMMLALPFGSLGPDIPQLHTHTHTHKVEILDCG